MSVHDMVQRGLMTCFVDLTGEFRAAPTIEGMRVHDCITAGIAVPCMGCMKPYPKVGVVPRFSKCRECRSSDARFELPRLA